MKTETVVIIGIAALVFGAPLLKALANGQDQGPMVQESPPGAVLDPFGGPTRVLDPTAIPTPTPVFSEQVIGGDVVTNDFIPYGPDVSVISIEEVGKQAGKWYLGSLPFLLNPVAGSIENVLSIF